SAASTLGQTVLTDFFAIYTAEEDRHLMSHLQQHPWDIDLLEVTLVAAQSAGGSQTVVMTNGTLAPSALKDWWRKSATSNRSGIGESRHDRWKLQGLVSSYERTHHPDLVAKIESITGCGSNGDVFQELTGYLVNTRTPSSLG